MYYETYPPHPDLEAIVRCYWVLEVPKALDAPKQRVIPDGTIEMCFILGDDIKRYTTDKDFIIQPRAMVFGQITRPYFVQPTGYVNTFAVRFYPYGFANFIDRPIKTLADKETSITELFGEEAKELENRIIEAPTTESRIEIIGNFLLQKLINPITIDHIVGSTLKALYATKGSVSISSILKDEPSKRRSLERKFSKQVGISPKQLGRIIRLQAVLKLMHERQEENLTSIAYESEYYDQAHFIKDFKHFTGVNPKQFFTDAEMMLSSLIYSKD
ncbi:helix-turn-helix domain-containing protein [Fulvivirga maritima]|uniref:AraC family transcriptional regulator n=1 Tax=Fulvivirga maritima TaxID=2904247 RepID=UPI001F21A68B|nr:helix-turn-helix domain-containing protein [Fulvivirga maritima]UII26017.1 helix-turn-helix domain-containing protein [Fulvivirga maritima]